MKKTLQAYAIEPPRLVNLSLSENPLGTSPVVLAAMRNQSLAPSVYPAANGNNLKKKLGQFLNCDERNIFIANGSEAIIYNIPRILAQPGDEVLLPELTFPLFAMYSRLALLQVKSIPMKKNLGIDLQRVVKNISPKTKLIFLCNPNNPTGMTIPRKKIINFLNQIPPSITVVIDEANIDFGGETRVDQALERQNVIVLRTFSKGFGLAGCRIGFAVGNEKLILQLTTQTQPFPISSLSEKLAILALSDTDFVQRSKKEMSKQRRLLKSELKQLGFTVFDSNANNIFIKLPTRITSEKFLSVLNENDISVVLGSKFPGFDDRFFRISPRTAKINNTFLQVMKSMTL